MVYQITSNDKDVVSEFKKMNYDTLLNLISKYNPELGLGLKVFSWGTIHGTLWERKRRINGLGTPSVEELIEYARKLASEQVLSEEEIELMRSPTYEETMVWVLQFFGLDWVREVPI